MSGRGAAGIDWLTLWAVARYRLGLTDEEFWALTPAQYHALSEQARYDKEWEDFRAGLICATLANVHRPKNRRAYAPQDFMPSARKQAKAQTWQDQLSLVRQLNVAFGGKG